MMKQTPLIEVNGQGVATVTLNTPDRHNAFDDQLVRALMTALTELAADKGLRAMVLAANGATFCAGGDLAWMKRMAGYSYQENLADAKALAAMFKTLNYFPRPTIAKVQGAAFGGGVGLIACCDAAIAVPQAVFALSEVKIGLIPATISPYVVAAIGQRAARRYFATGERFSARTAESLGLISEVVEKERLDGRLGELLAHVLENSPAAVSLAKQLVFNVADRPIDDRLLRYTSEEIASIRVSKEGQEGLTAFLEKRKPSWSL